MNPRVLELIKNPELFQNQDLDLLNLEIKKYPYIQNIRALYLFGIHKYSPENYQSVLSTTAAYTTDKKILYQFINKKAIIENIEQPVTETKKEPIADVAKKSFPIIPSETPKPVFNEAEKTSEHESKPVYVNGELNRILFEGEEDFLEQDNDVIDLESTLESGSIVTQTSEKEPVKSTEPENTEISTADEPENSEVFTPETVVNENEISGEEVTVDDDSELSFHGIEEFLPETKIETVAKSLETVFEKEETENTETIVNEVEITEEEPVITSPEALSFHGMEDFLPEIKITPNISETESYYVPKPVRNKQEDEMQRLIAEVEAKMKSSKKEKVQEEEIHQNKDVNFFETQSFEISQQTEEISVPQKDEDVEIDQQAISGKKTEDSQKPTEIQSTEAIAKVPSTEKSTWKPMSFSGNTPDSLIDHKKEKQSEGKATPIERISDQPKAVSENEEKNEEKTEDRPVFNLSFFTQKVSVIESEKIEEPADEILSIEEPVTENPDSNIPTFINTWQKWLKIDRKIDEGDENIPISKEKVIEDFIVKEPKISKLKEESDFVVKEKGDNISHLMTETLANLYTEQKLYSKAIKAYQILTEKHPDKKEYFENKINQIRELRQNK
ncbi:MAG: hypothetical protein L6264_03780 [Weeksellaceae bacterium]|nr:hypothetical protein [Bacteroidota bacterium]MCG2780044.1 hypothetical protein [Weeksellaceae bacterium]